MGKVAPAISIAGSLSVIIHWSLNPVIQNYSIASFVTICIEGQLPASHWLTHYQVPSIEKADLTIRFVEQIPEVVRYIELEETGFSTDAFVLFTKDTPPKKILVRFEEAGKGLTILCEKGAKYFPYLDLIIHSMCLLNGGTPLHASAFYYQNEIWLASGYPQGGKTSVLLAFLDDGAEFISDDWVYIRTDGTVFGLDLPITLRHWQLQQLPRIRKQLKTGKLKFLSIAKSLLGIGMKVPLLPHSIHRTIDKVCDKLDNQRNVTAKPQNIFTEQLHGQTGTIKKVLLPISHSDPAIFLEPVSAEIGMRYLLQMQLKEWDELFTLVAQYEGIFPDKTSILRRELRPMLERHIHRHFSDIPFYCVYHPHPVSLQAMHHTIVTSIE